MAQHAEAAGGHDGVVHHLLARPGDDFEALGGLRVGQRNQVAVERGHAFVVVLGGDVGQRVLAAPDVGEHHIGGVGHGCPGLAHVGVAAFPVLACALLARAQRHVDGAGGNLLLDLLAVVVDALDEQPQVGLLAEGPAQHFDLPAGGVGEFHPGQRLNRRAESVVLVDREAVFVLRVKVGHIALGSDDEVPVGAPAVPFDDHAFAIDPHRRAHRRAVAQPGRRWRRVQLQIALKVGQHGALLHQCLRLLEGQLGCLVHAGCTEHRVSGLGGRLGHALGEIAQHSLD